MGSHPNSWCVAWVGWGQTPPSGWGQTPPSVSNFTFCMLFRKVISQLPKNEISMRKILIGDRPQSDGVHGLSLGIAQRNARLRDDAPEERRRPEGCAAEVDQDGRRAGRPRWSGRSRVGRPQQRKQDGCLCIKIALHLVLRVCDHGLTCWANDDCLVCSASSSM